MQVIIIKFLSNNPFEFCPYELSYISLYLNTQGVIQTDKKKDRKGLWHHHQMIPDFVLKYLGYYLLK